MATRWRFEVTLKDCRVLADYMSFRGESVRSLAKKVGCSAATIGHLRRGTVKRTRKDWAKAIERHLDTPVGALFVATVSCVSQDAA
jgi:DNA-binding Xre family transcriptional regulator